MSPENDHGFTRFDLAEGVRLWVLPDQRFKSVQIRVWIHRALDEETTRAALLPAVLRRGCRRLETMSKIAAYLEGLFGASYGADVQKMGDRQVLGFHMDVLHDRFVPRGGGGLLDRAVDFLSRMVTQPARRGKGLRPDYVQGEKENQRRMIEGLVNDRGTYAYERCLRTMCAGEPYERYEHGRLEDIPPITAEGLGEFHERLLSTAPVEIFVSGDVVPARIHHLVARRFPFKRRAFAGPPLIQPDPEPREPREVIERMEVEQGHVVIGCRTGTRWSDPAIWDLSFANALLGGFPHSKLFRNVREREGLAYSTSSSFDPAKGLVFITAGIDPGKFEMARKVILEQLEAVKAGDLTQEEMDKTRASLLNRIRSRRDSPSARLSFFHELNTFGAAKTEAEVMAAYEAVTRERAAAAARRIRVDTVYFLTRPV